MASAEEPSSNVGYHFLKSLRENPGKTLLVRHTQYKHYGGGGLQYVLLQSCPQFSLLFFLIPLFIPYSLPPSPLLLFLPVSLQVVEREAVTGLELHQRISSAVHLLKMKGVVPGNRVLITMQPSVDFYALAVASFAVGKNCGREGHFVTCRAHAHVHA